MKVPVCFAILLALLLAAGGCGGAATGPAIQVADPWVRIAGAGANSAGYMTLRNTGRTADRLVSAGSDIASAVELHKSEMKDGMMTMSPVEGIDVPAGGEAQLKSGGLHIMFIGLKQPLKAGDKVQIKLRFKQASEVTIQAEVRAQ